MNNEEIAEFLFITDEQAEYSDIGGDTDADDDLPRNTPNASNKRSDISISPSSSNATPIRSKSDTMGINCSKDLSFTNGNHRSTTVEIPIHTVKLSDLPRYTLNASKKRPGVFNTPLPTVELSDLPRNTTNASVNRPYISIASSLSDDTPIQSKSDPMWNNYSSDPSISNGGDQSIFVEIPSPTVEQSQCNADQFQPTSLITTGISATSSELPSTSKGLVTKNKLYRKCKAQPIAAEHDSDYSLADDTDEDPTFDVVSDQIKGRKKLQLPQKRLYFTSSDESDSEQHPTSAMKTRVDDHTYSSPIKKNSKDKKGKETKKNVPNPPAKKQPKIEKKYHWCKTAAPPNKFHAYQYNQKFGLNVDLPSHDPMSIFKLIFDDDISQVIVEESNRYALQQNAKLDLTVEELNAFIGILIFMGFHALPSMRDYWSEDENFHVERIARVMPVKRFLKILRFVHINDNSKMPKRGTPEFDRLYKIRPLLNHLKTKFMVLFSPSRHLAVDESMVGFKGRSTLKQYMPKKPIKRGFKIWVCACSETGYVLAFDVYTGRKSDGSELKLGEKVVLELTASFTGLGHCLYFDNFFSSVELVNTLFEDKTFSCGTILQTRIAYPDNLKPDKSIKKHDYDFAQCGEISVVKWVDRGKKAVSVISTFHNPSVVTSVQRANFKGERETVPCPQAVADYNKYMGGVDRFDQQMSSYSIVQKSRRWWLKLFYYFLDASVVNSYTMYSYDCKIKNMKPCSALRYRFSLANQLIGNFCSKKKRGFAASKGRARKRNVPTGRPTVQNAIRLCNVGAHLPQIIEKYRRCAHCSTKKKEKRSNMLCAMCNVALCKQCFVPFHKC